MATKSVIMLIRADREDILEATKTRSQAITTIKNKVKLDANRIPKNDA